jgi:flagellin-like hook-associated protein FlgL
MTSINAGGAFYRVQNSLNQNSENVSKSMQRLASGSKILRLVIGLLRVPWPGV